MLSATEQDRICEVRERTGWGPRLIASEVGHPHSTVHRTLQRHGCSRRPRAPREAVVRYEWPCPGQLLHIDTKRLQRFSRPGHAVTGDRTAQTRGARHEFAHSIVDDYSRPAYTEVLDDERAATVTAFTQRALDWFLGHGIVTERLMTDNAWCYVKNRGLRDLLSARDRPQAHAALHPQDQRQGRALPADPRPRVGEGPDLQHLNRPSCGPATLA
jgi:hypothetical protein